MTKQEMIKIFAILKTAFPKMIDGMGEERIRLTIELWNEMFADMPYEVTERAVRKYIIDATYPPTIADIRRYCVEATQGELLTWETAYGEMMRAISNFGMYRQDEMLASLRPATRTAMECIGVNSVLEEPTDDGMGTLRAQFRDVYKNVVEREKKNLALPERLKGLIGTIGQIEGAK